MKPEGGWLQLPDGRWINLHYCDQLDFRQLPDGQWEVRAWSAYQAQSEPWVVGTCKDRKAAEELAAGLVRAIRS